MPRNKEETEGLSLLGNKKTVYKDTYAPEVLETFVNKHQDNDYMVTFDCPEFTSLCPITGQPDFARHCTYFDKYKNPRTFNKTYPTATGSRCSYRRTSFRSCLFRSFAGNRFYQEHCRNRCYRTYVRSRS